MVDNIYGEYSGGSLVGVYRNSGDLAPFQATDAEIEDCCCEAPGSCPYADTDEGPSRLRIVGYTDGDIPASSCGDCAEEQFPDDRWPGEFAIRSGNCTWVSTAYYGIDGKDFYGFAGPQSSVTLDGANGWKIQVLCYADDYSANDCWVGYKTTGSDPTGTYTYASGCAGGPSSLELESY